MAQRLADLVSRLQEDVPPLSGIPSASQAQDAVQDAVSEFSGLAPVVRAITVNVVKDTSTYALPADFQRLRSFAGLPRQGSVILSSEIIPISGPITVPLDEQVTISGSDLVIFPVPAYTLARTLTYEALHLLDEETGAYPHLTDAQGRAILLKARANVLRLQATKAAAQARQYQLGDERISKEKLSTALLEQAKEFDRQFDAAVGRLRGETGMGGRASPYGTRARVEL